MKIDGRLRLTHFISLLMWALLAANLVACAAVPSAVVNPPLSTLRVVMDNNYPPYVFQNDQGELQGILIDQWKMWEARSGVKVEITARPWGDALQRMTAGEFDVIDTIFYTDDRAKIFDFTAPYARINVPIFFQKNISGLASVDDLKGFRVAVKTGDANADYLANHGLTDLAYYHSYEDIVKAAADKAETIFVIDEPPALYYLYKYGLQDQFKHSDPLYSGEFHRAVKEGNTPVLNLVVNGFAAITPAEYQAIDRHWLGTGEANNAEQWVPYLAVGAIGVLLIILALMVFNRALQMRVKQRTQELEETAKALAESEEIFRLFMEHSPIYVFFKDEQTRSLRLSRNYEHMLGRPLSELLGKTMDELFPSELAKNMLADDLRILREGQQVEVVEDLAGRIYKTTKFPIVEQGHPRGLAGYTIDITEQRRAELALKESERLLNRSQAIAHVGHWQWDTRTNQVLWSDEMYHIFGIERGAFTGDLDEIITAAIHPDDRERVVQSNERVLTEQQPGTLEYRVVRPDGSIRHVWAQPGDAVRDEQGKIILLSGVVQDMTERKHAEEALRLSEDKFSKAFHISPDSININRLSDGLYLEINEGFTAITGYTEADVRGKTSRDINIWADPAARARLVQDLQAHGQVANLEAAFRGKDGRIIIGLMSARLIEVGGVPCLLNITRDITERKRAEEALRESEEKFRAMIEQASEGFALIDEQGYILEWNRAKERIWGLKREEVLGRPFYEVQFQVVIPKRRTPEHYEALKKMTLDALRTGQSPLFEGVIEGELCRPDGQRVVIQQSIFLIKSSAGFRIGSVSLDITERKRTEAEIKQLNQDLERRVAERTRELAAANARLTELDQLKSKFVSDVSHELRTPIANLKLYIDLLNRGKPEKQEQYLAVLHQQVRRVAALVDDILDLSRLERRKERGLTTQAVALNEVAAQVVLAHQPRAEADSLSLTFQPAPDLPLVRGDADQLAQVVTNLVANALNYTEAGYVRVSTLAEHGEVCLCVADSGSGIAVEDVPHIFERFYRGRHILKNEVPGTGLGLAIVKEIVELHQGHIEVENQPVHGSIFKVWLPLA